MTAHFKIGRIAAISPRLRNLDDQARTGSVFIGNIGPRPTSARSNKAR